MLKAHLTFTAKKENLSHLEKKLPACPICGHKAFISHDVVDGADMGYSSGCRIFRLYDKKHGIVDLKDPRAPKFSGFTAKEAYDKWIEYCRRMNDDGLAHSPVADEDRELHRPLLVEDGGLEEARRGL